MTNFSKAIGSLVSGLVGLGAIYGFVPEEFATPAMISGVSMLLVQLFGTFFAPPNTPAE